MKRVMVAAPSYDGTITVWHASSLTETCKMGLTKDINVFCIYMSYDALVQRARNDIVQLAIDNEVDELVFIDCDIDWDPNDFFKLLEHDVDIVGATYPKKGDDETYPIKIKDGIKGWTGVDEKGLVEIEGIGTGFLKISKKALKEIYESCEEYTEPHKEKPIKMVFDIKIQNGELVSEDISFCDKWRDLGGKIYLDPSIDLSHVGTKRWTGNFLSWVERIKEQ